MIIEKIENADLKFERYWNEDIAPITKENRKWHTKDFLMLWIALSSGIPTYMIASSFIAEGMSCWQALLTVLLANLIILIPMLLNAQVGTKYGIPFPVYCRASFGIIGANFPAALRAFVAIGWSGIQMWIGAEALYALLSYFFPNICGGTTIGFLKINVTQLTCFLFFCSVNLYFIYKGIDSIRNLVNIQATVLTILGLILLFWAYQKANGFGPIFSQPSSFIKNGPKDGQFWKFFFPSLTAAISFWATLSLNIPDFSRYAHKQQNQIIGQIFGLPLGMVFYAFIGIAVTSATVIIYGEAIWDPIKLMTRFSNHIASIITMIAICLATLSTNITANIVSPANDLSHLYPQKISFKIGGYLTIIFGIIIQPWKIMADPAGYILKWLVAYSSLLGAIGGILIADYYLLKNRRLDLINLYKKNSPYWYYKGINFTAIIACLLGIGVCLPGMFSALEIIKFSYFWDQIYQYAWFISFITAFACYLIFTASLTFFKKNLNHIKHKQRILFLKRHYENS